MLVSIQPFKVSLYIPAQAASETEALIAKWHVTEGDNLSKGQAIAEIESAKSTFDFEAPCEGKVIRLLYKEGDTVTFDKPVIEIETEDESMKNEIPFADTPKQETSVMEIPKIKSTDSIQSEQIAILGIGGYAPERIVTTQELVKDFPDVTEDYIFGLTGIRERRWAQPSEKPTDMAYRASIQAIET